MRWMYVQHDKDHCQILVTSYLINVYTGLHSGEGGGGLVRALFITPYIQRQIMFVSLDNVILEILRKFYRIGHFG